MYSIKTINIMNIDDFKNHPYRIEYDEEMELLIDSIRRNGLINPLVVRKKGDDRYEMISGHRRKRALEALMMYNVDAYIYDLSDDVATIMMVDSNLHRENILLSEKAFAYKMRYDAMKHQGRTLGHNVPKKNTADEIGAIYGESGRTIKRYIRLTYLIPELLDLVDNKYSYEIKPLLSMGLLIATELSYLTKEEQRLLYNTIEYEQATPNITQAKKIRYLSERKRLDFDTLEEILTSLKPNQKERFWFYKERIEKVLPQEIKSKTKDEIEKYIIEAIKEYKKSKT